MVFAARRREMFVLSLSLLFLITGLGVVAADTPVATVKQVKQRVNIEAHNEPVQSVLARLGHANNANITIATDVSGYVTIELHHVTIEQALKAIVTPLGAEYRLRDGVYAIERMPSRQMQPNSSTPSVLPLTIITAGRAAARLRPLFPQASIREDAQSNSLVVIATPADLQSMRTVLQGIDVKSPTTVVTQAIAVRTTRADKISSQLHESFPSARIAVVGEKQLLVTAIPSDLEQIKNAVLALDSPLVTPPPTAMTSEAVRVIQRRPQDIARAVTRQVANVRAAVSGGTVVLTGPPDAVMRAKALVAQIDLPPFDARYTQVYRIRSFDAASVADLLRRSFRDIDISVDTSLNALAVNATAAQQQRIADSLAQLDAPQTNIPGAAGFAGLSGGGSTTELITLKSAMPGQNLGGVDPVSAIVQALTQIAPDIKVLQLGAPGQLALIGPASSIRNAKDFIEKVDIIPPQVVLDTEILEIDETVAKNLGLQLTAGTFSTTFSETTPPVNADGTAGKLIALQPLTRTPISFAAQINALIQNGTGRVLADPRITTLSGHTATIRAGDTISILTTTSGNAGTIATTQIQSFQTGVTLDITPLVDAQGGITVLLHPVVNSLTGTLNGVPEISTRDTQTTVHLHNEETLVIGGLIQESNNRTINKIPILGDLPLVGKLFQNSNVNDSRNELIIVVTPHIVVQGATVLPGPPFREMPVPKALPTLPPDARLPEPNGQLPAKPIPTPVSAVAPAAAPPTASPAPAPSAFAATNVFTFGSAPQNNFAKSTDPAQIFFATLSPTVVSNGTSVRVAAITTSNVNAVKLQIGNQAVGLGQIGPGRWQGTFPFPAGSYSNSQSAITLALTATKLDGGSATIPIVINISP